MELTGAVSFRDKPNEGVNQANLCCVDCALAPLRLLARAGDAGTERRAADVYPIARLRFHSDTYIDT